MKFIKPLGILTAVAFIASCGGNAENITEDLEDVLTISLTGEVALPEQMALVTPSDDDSRSLQRSMFGRAVHNVSGYAADSAFNKARQNNYVWLDAVEPISFIDDFLCFTGQTNPLQMLGEGDYVAWADADRCFEEKDGSGQQQGSGNDAQLPSYVTIVANSTQAANTDPLVLNGWIEDFSGQSGGDGGPDAIKLLGTVSQTPTEANPFGVFSLTYGLLPTLSGTQANSTGYGEVSSSETDDGGAAFTLYQYDLRPEQGGNVECTTTASVDYNDSTETGKARTARQCFLENTTTATQGNGAYALAVDADYVHMAMAANYAGLSSPDTEVCLMRNDFQEVAWSYGMFNKADGSAVDVNSGMQIKVDADGDGSGSDANGFESWGHIGYHGSWREDGQSFSDGETVQQATWDDTTGANYTVKVAPGRLVKNTVESVDLSDLAGVSFNTYMNENDTYMLSVATDFNTDTDTNDGLDLVIQVNGTDDGFEVVGIQDGWSDSGPQITDVNPAIALPLNASRSLYLWSNQLGGDVKFNTGSTKVRLFSRTYVNGSETGSGELFDGTNTADLVCIERCLEADVLAADIAGGAQWEDVFNTNDSQTVVNYDFSKADLTLVTDGGSNAIGFDSAVTSDNVDNSQHWQWGLQTGPMVPTGGATDASTFYSGIENGTITEFYVWETGMNSWQQQTVLLDGSNDPVTFDQPITFTYVHEQANDRNDNNAHNSAVFMLEYGGKGQLHGLPWEGQGDRWFPVLSLADGTILGSSDQYVIKALEVEQKMTQTSLSNCSALPLNAPSQSVPTGIEQDVFGLGAIPNVGDQPPVVIDGEIVE